MASVVVKCKDGPMPHPSVAFQLKCEREAEKLNGRLRKRLQNDMLNLFQEKSFADLSFVTEDLSEISAHSCILRTRAANFYCLYVKKQLHGQLPVRIELYHLDKKQLQNFLRGVYCGEEVEEEESLIIHTLNLVEQKLMDYNKETVSTHSFVNNMEVQQQNFEGLEGNSQASPSQTKSEPQLHSSLDSEVNEMLYSSSLSGTHTDLTDQFSLSASDIIGMSTMNANDDVEGASSIISVEDLTISESSAAAEINVKHIGVPEEICDSMFSSSPALNSVTVQAVEICHDDDLLLEICSVANSKSVTSEEPVPIDLQSCTTILDSKCQKPFSEARLAIRRGTFELDAEELANFSNNATIIKTDNSQDKTLVIEESFANEVHSTVDAPMMLRSHESRDGDSGVCSMVRKLSTSSSFGHRSNCSEHAPDSPSESLPKDDSLEFCPDSLASEDVQLAFFSGGPSDSGISGTDVSQTELHKSNIRKSRPPSLDKELFRESLQKGVACRKDVWAEGVRETHVDNEIELRRWSYSCGEVHQKGASKPSAIIPPYNAFEDVSMPSKSMFMAKDAGDDIQLSSVGCPVRHKIDKQTITSAPCSVQLDFVPFLKEERTTDHSSTFSDGRGHLHHAVLASTPILGPRTFNESDIKPNLFSNPDKELVHLDADVDLLGHGAVLDIASLPILSGFSYEIPTGFEDNVKVSSKSPEDESEACKPEGLFMFIDIGDSKSNTDTHLEVKMHEKSVDQSSKSPKMQAEGFYFIPADVKPLCSSENITCSLDDEPITKISAPQSVYMYIDATNAPTVVDCPSPSKKHPRLIDKKGPVIRRRIHTGSSASPNRRPKSESAVTLLANAADSELCDKAGKRVSLTFGEESDEATYSIESSKKSDIKSQIKSCSRLGEDLLRMFLDEINPDVTIRIGDKDIKAHKSILTSRCVYFAAMLSGGWVESAGNIIKLQGFSYESLHFALCHIYGGSSSVPDSIDISELASLADMLGLEGLKEVVMLTLKIKMCHFFHKPCATCTTSVSECLLIATSFGLDEVQEKCLRWITKYMLKTWPTKAFAALPEEILQKCFFSAKMEITPDTVLDTLLCCDKMMATLPHVKWTEPVFSLTSLLADSASSYLSVNFADVLTSNSFLSLKTGQSWSIHALETTFLLAVEKLPLDGACNAYVRLHALLNVHSQSDYLENPDINENFVALVTKIHRQVEHFLIHNANRIVRCSSWNRLSPDLQKRIKDAAVIVFEFGKPTAPPPRLSSLNRKFTRTRASNSTSSASPTIERARVPSCISGSARNIQKNAGIHKADKKEAKNDTKAATLPRTNCKAFPDTKVQDGSLHTGAASSLGSVRASSRSHTNSRTVPMTKTTELKKLDLNARRETHSSSQSNVGAKSGVQPKNTAVNASMSNISYTVGASRPKSWPIRERHTPVACDTRVREKTPVRELSKEARLFPVNNGIMLKSTTRLSNGSVKTLSPAPNPKLLVCNGSSSCNGSNGRIAKLVGSPALNVRDSRASSLRKAVSSDFQGKESKDELKHKTVTRPRSDDVSLTAGRKPAQRLPLNRKPIRPTSNTK